MSTCLLVILMGAKVDEPHARKIAEAAFELGMESELRIGSAHKSPEHVLDLLKAYEADPRPKVYITIAGRSNALSAFVDGAVSAPVIACPPPAEFVGGVDIWSSVRMPGGIAPAFIMDASNAALLAAKILSPFDPGIAAGIARLRQANVDAILDDDRAISKPGTDERTKWRNNR
ncbi:MAG: AIR carboxylase family protein [Spirochaetota bacterium]